MVTALPPHSSAGPRRLHPWPPWPGLKLGAPPVQRSGRPDVKSSEMSNVAEIISNLSIQTLIKTIGKGKQTSTSWVLKKMININIKHQLPFTRQLEQGWNLFQPAPKPGLASRNGPAPAEKKLLGRCSNDWATAVYDDSVVICCNTCPCYMNWV